MTDTTISAAKLAACQAAAKHSTGPRSDAGKAISSKNAIKNGLCSKDVLLPGEDEEEYGLMMYEYSQQVKPLGSAERTLFDELCAAAWKLRRAQRMETEALSKYGDDLLASLDDDTLQKKLDNLARHKARLERTFHRSLKELKALQTQRLQHNLTFGIKEPLPGLAKLPKEAMKASSALNTKRTDHDDVLDDPEAFRAKFLAGINDAWQKTGAKLYEK